MKNIIDICKAQGIEVPEDKAENFEKAVLENYRTIAEVDKLRTKIEKLDGDLKTANETITTLETSSKEEMEKAIADYKKQAEDSKKNYEEQLAKRDYSDALSKLMDGVKFTSESAKRAILSDLEKNPLQLRDGAILGFDDYLKKAKETDPSAFVNEEKEQLEQKKAKFTTGTNDNQGGGAKTKEEIMSIKDATERQQAIKENIGLFVSQK